MKKKLIKKTKKSFVIKLLNIVGIFFLIIAGFFILSHRRHEMFLDIGSILLFISIILMIPDAWIFIRDKRHLETEMDSYWFTKFLILPLVLVFCIIYFIKRLTE